MRTGLYERAESPYSSKWFCIPKKDGKLRLVHGVERMNSITIKDAGVPPVLEPFVESFVGRKSLISWEALTNVFSTKHQGH